jgi:CRISPR/Cas system CSM-associated protein Csm4 (group 5 of RAMP superfamily)
MEKETLVKSASKITKVSEDSLKEYMDKMDMLAAKINEAMLKREDIFELIGGEKNITMMKDNHNNHLRFIASVLQTPDSETLVDSVLWVFRSYMSRGFNSNYWAAQLNTWIRLLKENLSEKAFSEIFSIYNWMSVNIPKFSIAADEKLEKSKHLDH